MRKYAVVISPKASVDIDDFFDFICFECKQPLTAIRNKEELLMFISRFPSYAGSIAVSRSDYITSRFGRNARRINFKKMAIIYVIRGASVHIKRVISGALIY